MVFFMRKAGKQEFLLYSCFPHKKSVQHNVQGVLAHYSKLQKKTFCHKQRVGRPGFAQG